MISSPKPDMKPAPLVRAPQKSPAGPEFLAPKLFISTAHLSSIQLGSIEYFRLQGVSCDAWIVIPVILSEILSYFRRLGCSVVVENRFMCTDCLNSVVNTRHEYIRVKETLRGQSVSGVRRRNPWKIVCYASFKFKYDMLRQGILHPK